MNAAAETPSTHGFGRLEVECGRRGIGRSKAFQLARDGWLDTFLIGGCRYVKIASLESLPDRLSQASVAGDQKAAQ